MRRALAAGVLAALLAGCGRDSAPLTTHGKPVAEWVAALNDPSPRVRKKAVVALGHAVPADADALPAVIGALKDRDPGVRAEAVLALLNLGADAKDAVPALTEATRDRDARVRTYAAKALARIQGGD